MTTPEWTIGRLLTWTTDFLRDKGADSPRLDAEVLLAHARGSQRIELYTAFEEEAPEPLRTAFRELVKRRAAGTPVAYLVGHREFFSMSFEVSPAVLIPRPETELLVVRTLDLARGQFADCAPLRIADVGTGSGVLAICCAKHIPRAEVTALDVSGEALAVAERNAVKHGVEERISFFESDLFAECPPGEFEIVLSNPPYVSSAEMKELSDDVRAHEPHLALDGGEGGVEVIRRLVPQAAKRLVEGGWFLIEASPYNAEQVESLVAATEGLTVQPTINDPAGHPRVVVAQRN